ncbi:hypothetical protein HA402_013803 [Bradysia odoriphaga]|nr:hypothetical protein HA402_013803 [Bradysia odoriphaga]
MDQHAAELMDLLHSANNHEDVVKCYSGIAETFDKIQESLAYVGAKNGVKKCLEKCEVPKTARILDIGAGTGIVGEMLQSMGYDNLDALDGCQELLEKSRERNCYRNLFCSFVVPDAELPVEKKAYDLVVMPGVVYPAHILPTAFGQVIKVVKKGGLISWDMMVGEPEAYQKEIGVMFREENFEKYVNSYVDDGLWELVGKYDITFVERPSATLNENAVCYVMRVLK